MHHTISALLQYNLYFQQLATHLLVGGQVVSPEGTISRCPLPTWAVVYKVLSGCHEFLWCQLKISVLTNYRAVAIKCIRQLKSKVLHCYIHLSSTSMYASYHTSLSEFGVLKSGSEVLGNLEAFGLGLVEYVLHRHVGSTIQV